MPFFYTDMTSEERHEERYKRRKAARDAERQRFIKEHGGFSLLTDLDNLYDAYRKCTKGVNWKGSTQRYTAKWMVNIINTERNLKTGKDMRKGFVSFNLRERGKERNIRSVHISERVVQKVLCDQILVPILSRSLIYDNGASLRHRGTSFAVRRLVTHLRRYHKQYGADGYALMVDYSKYFDTISHKILLDKIKRYITDKKVFKLVTDFITAFGGGMSLGLGSQISQVGAIFFPGKEVDHFAKERLRIKYYGRYMDDLYLIHHSKAYLTYCLEEIVKASEKIGLHVNMKKTRIVTLRHGLVFLKGRYSLTDTGKVLRLPVRSSTVRIRKRLVKFKQLAQRKKMTYRGVYDSYQSWRGTFSKRFNAYYRVKKMDALYNKLFLEEDYHESVSQRIHR
jgi:hypothetical protein